MGGTPRSFSPCETELSSGNTRHSAELPHGILSASSAGPPRESFSACLNPYEFKHLQYEKSKSDPPEDGWARASR